ncbi:MAG: adenine/guanine/hypoxanthine permease [Verrucomicrobiota bacterium]|jgi:AGZA family xanthine/uracil permease-like MFS transporter|nr:adenine/guanine/hypoxanthine permease [Verrucomicrobiota bacterium]MDK2963172.1 adenine/guanine/hypoxanthine permease [Verrucomicrobiota bacterium]
MFKLKENGSDVKTEMIGGLTTFLTMAYIIFVNPLILSEAGMDKPALITATCLAAALGTLLVALWANVPFAMAPGMGLNAFFTYTLVMGQGLDWQTALGVVFVSGVAFFVLTVAGIREKVVNAIPLSLRISTAAGIGLFITFIGLKNMGLIVDNPATLISIGPMTRPVLIGLGALLLITILELRKVKGSILIGIAAATIAGVFFGEVAMPDRVCSAPPSLAPIAFQLDIASALKWGLVGAIFSFMFVDLFDSIGTIVACSYEAGHVEPDGTIKNIDKVLEADAVATVAGALLGTSTTTTYIESASGIADGARTGLASVVTGLLFLAALFFAPLIGAVPGFATAPALVIVGVFMFRNIQEIDFSDMKDAVPAFLTMILMPLTFSISTGLTVGFLAYLLISILSGGIKQISPVMWVVGLLSAINLVVTTVH